MPEAMGDLGQKVVVETVELLLLGYSVKLVCNGGSTGMVLFGILLLEPY